MLGSASEALASGVGGCLAGVGGYCEGPVVGVVNDEEHMGLKGQPRQGYEPAQRTAPSPPHALIAWLMSDCPARGAVRVCIPYSPTQLICRVGSTCAVGLGSGWFVGKAFIANNQVKTCSARSESTTTRGVRVGTRRDSKVRRTIEFQGWLSGEWFG